VNKKTALLALAITSGISNSYAAEALSPLYTLSAEQTAQAICSKQVTSQEVVKYWLQRIDARPQLNAFIAVDHRRALAEAKKVDARLSSGRECRPLDGVPIAIKDNIQVVGFANTAGTPALRHFMPKANAPIIDKLEAAGAIILGKTNMHELAFGVTGYNLGYHTKDVIGIRNAFDQSRISGGSSSGSAVALGARMVPIALGTDTGGSTREPCALNGCLGFRPTVGRYSGQGITPISPTRDTAGPMANTVGDVVLLDSILSGKNPLPAKPANGIRLGLPDFFWADLDSDVGKAASQALEKLQAAGVQVVPVQMPKLKELAAAVATPVAIVEAMKALSAYLKEQNTGVSFDQLASQVASPDVKAIFNDMVVPVLVPGADGKMVAGQPIYDQAIKESLPRLEELYKRTFAENKIDALLFPAVPEVAIKTGPEAGTPENFLRIIRNSDPSSNVKMPGLSIPIGLGEKSKLPVGMEIDSLPGQDDELLAISRTLESIWGPGPIPSIAH